MILMALFQHNLKGQSGNWRIVIFTKPATFATEIHLVQERLGKLFTASIGKGGELIMTEVKDGMETKPMMTLPYEAWLALSDCLSEVIPETKKEIVDAELKATKFHLEDMRKLLKIK